MIADKVVLERDPIWYKNVGILLASNRLQEFWPHPMQTREEKVNAVVRFSMYASMALYLINRKPKYLIMGIVATLIISLAYTRMPPSTDIKPMPRPQKAIRQPTEDNPFGNPLAYTPAFEDDKKNPPSETDSGKMEITRDTLLKKGVFMNIESAWDKYSLERQFYTMPEHDTGVFARYLYGGMDKSMKTRAEKTSHIG